VVGASKFVYLGASNATPGEFVKIGRLVPKRTIAPGGNGSSAASAAFGSAGAAIAE
jgi:hypothetical protein